MGKFQSSKVFDGFSTVFRQWKAETTHIVDFYMVMVFHLKYILKVN